MWPRLREGASQAKLHASVAALGTSFGQLRGERWRLGHFGQGKRLLRVAVDPIVRDQHHDLARLVPLQHELNPPPTVTVP
eukprot:scaffold1962_cov241-Pinguiococcus_pyrenoidosus.AAC.1